LRNSSSAASCSSLSGVISHHPLFVRIVFIRLFAILASTCLGFYCFSHK
jgi:hypothetical protein